MIDDTADFIRRMDLMEDPTPAELDTLREIATDWHGGQWSHLYQFGSSGVLECSPAYCRWGYLREIKTAERDTRNSDDPAHQKNRLRLLRSYMEAHAVEYDPDSDTGAQLDAAAHHYEETP